MRFSIRRISIFLIIFVPIVAARQQPSHKFLPVHFISKLALRDYSFSHHSSKTSFLIIAISMLLLFFQTNAKAQCSINDFSDTCGAKFDNYSCGTCPIDHCTSDGTVNCGGPNGKISIVGNSTFCNIDSIQIIPSDTTMCWSSCVAIAGTPPDFWTPLQAGCTTNKVTYVPGPTFGAGDTMDIQFCGPVSGKTFTVKLFSGSIRTSFMCTLP